MNELDKFGKIIVGDIYNQAVNSLEKDMEGTYESPELVEVNNLFNKLTNEEKALLLEINTEVIKTVIFEILQIFDENKNYKLMYQKDDELIDLQHIAEEDNYGNGYLYGELFNWLEKYSK